MSERDERGVRKEIDEQLARDLRAHIGRHPRHAQPPADRIGRRRADEDGGDCRANMHCHAPGPGAPLDRISLGEPEDRGREQRPDPAAHEAFQRTAQRRRRPPDRERVQRNARVRQDRYRGPAEKRKHELARNSARRPDPQATLHRMRQLTRTAPDLLGGLVWTRERPSEMYGQGEVRARPRHRRLRTSRRRRRGAPIS